MMLRFAGRSRPGGRTNVVVINDARQKIEDALRKSEERFRRVVESAPSAMVMIDPAGRIEMVNAQSEELFGYPREEMLGQPIEMLVPVRYRTNHPGLRAGFLLARWHGQWGRGATSMG